MRTSDLSSDVCSSDLLIDPFQILKPDNIIIGPQYFIQEISELSRLLGKLNDEIIFQSFVDQATFDHFWITRQVVITSADDANHFFPPDLCLQLIQRCH